MPFSKRTFDLIVTRTVLILLSPVILLTALLVRIFLGTPILFRQTRPGYKGKPFTIFKFHTMSEKRDEQGNLLPDDQRLTRFGRFLRSTSLDELPELFNILRGEMSLVGAKALADGISAAVFARTIAAARCPSRSDRLGTGQRAQCAHVAG